jgi:hypothetical protein
MLFSVFPKGNFSKSPGNSYWIPASAGIQKMLAIDDLPQLIEKLPQKYLTR